MTDTPDNPTGDATTDENSSNGAVAGQRLARARRARDISITEIAKELHLDEPKVQALEENQFEALGAPVFAKGHLRKYAELVDVSIEDVLTDYYQLNRSAGAPPVVGPARTQPRDMKLVPWVAIAVAVLITAAILYWFMTRNPSEELVRTPGMLEPYVEQPADTSGSTAADSLDDDVVLIEAENDASAEGQNDDVDAPAGELLPVYSGEQESQETGPVADPVLGQVSIVMSFSGECWTEVTDADGNRLFFGLGQAGQTVNRSGTAPLQALFGDRNNVTVTVNGEDFPISSGGRRGNTARVTIEQ